MRRAIGSGVQGGRAPAHPGPGQPVILVEGGDVMPRMTGARFMVQTMRAYGVTHAFYDTEAYGSLIRRL